MAGKANEGHANTVIAAVAVWLGFDGIVCSVLLGKMFLKMVLQVFSKEETKLVVRCQMAHSS